MNKIQRELLERLRDLDLRVSVLERFPTPIVFAIGKTYPEPQECDMQTPSPSEH